MVTAVAAAAAVVAAAAAMPPAVVSRPAALRCVSRPAVPRRPASRRAALPRAAAPRAATVRSARSAANSIAAIAAVPRAAASPRAASRAAALRPPAAAAAAKQAPSLPPAPAECWRESYDRRRNACGFFFAQVRVKGGAAVPAARRLSLEDPFRLRRCKKMGEAAGIPPALYAKRATKITKRHEEEDCRQLHRRPSDFSSVLVIFVALRGPQVVEAFVHRQTRKGVAPAFGQDPIQFRDERDVRPA